MTGTAAAVTREQIRDQASRYLQAVYGPDVVYRAPETFGNLVERWIWAVAAGAPQMAEASMADIERLAAQQRGAGEAEGLPAAPGEGDEDE